MKASGLLPLWGFSRPGRALTSLDARLLLGPVSFVVDLHVIRLPDRRALASKTVRGRMWRAIHEDGVDKRSHPEHRAILAAVAGHVPEGARIRMGAHLLAVEEYLSRDADVPTNLLLNGLTDDMATGADFVAGQPR